MSDDAEPKEVECDHCGELRLCCYASDPYVAEVSGSNTEPLWWCDDCYSSRHDDV